MLDEPFGALDAFTREELWSVMQNLWIDQRFTAILVTHDLREAVYLSDTVYVMSQRPGRIIYTSKVDLPRPRRLQTTFEPHFIDIVQALRERHQSRPCPMIDARRLQLVAPWAVTIGLFVVWEFACWLFAVPAFILPRPSLFFRP